VLLIFLAVDFPTKTMHATSPLHLIVVGFVVQITKLLIMQLSPILIERNPILQIERTACICGSLLHSLCEGDEINIDANCRRVFRAKSYFLPRFTPLTAQ
jgi:hypothetical protein